MMPVVLKSRAAGASVSAGRGGGRGAGCGVPMSSPEAPCSSSTRGWSPRTKDSRSSSSSSSSHRSLISTVLGVLLVLLVLSEHVHAIQWLALSSGKQRFWNKTRHCSRKRTAGLLKAQVQICKQHLELMPVIARAAKEVKDVCQELFRESRWNCSSVRSAPNYLADLTGGSREQAFIYSLSTAALAQATAKACSVGATTKCSCGRLPNEPPIGDFKWGGCGDDIDYGLKFSESFADQPWNRKSKKSKKSLMNIHNNGVGRKIVRDSLTTACKCHGVSGSCSVKTCWMALPDVRTLGATLQRRYAVAMEVRRRRKRQARNMQPNLVPIFRSRGQKVTELDLVYFTKSPDYCLPDVSLGALGTRGRDCKKDLQGSAGCKSMCCGRGYTSEVVEIKQRCDCKYYWCCYVKCKTCTKKVEINRCR